jgi:sec-independent protein translocase protein TatB
MFDVAPTEFLLVAVVALIVIGPKDLPRVMRAVGQWVAKARDVARQMERKWQEENERIMREHPPLAPDGPAAVSPPAEEPKPDSAA